ncbi:MAG: DUF421 domain-containing protein [Acidobacteriota bacterium]
MPIWQDILLRSIGVFATLLVLVRLMGKRQTAPLTFFDLVTAIAIGTIGAAISLKLIPVLPHGLVAMAVWVALPISIYYAAVKSKMVRDLVQGKETVLINHGRVLEDKLMEARMTPEDLLSRLRTRSVFNFADVEFAVLEPDGQLSTMLKKDKQPVTANTLGIQVNLESVPQTVMLDGAIIDDHLSAMGLNRNWLYTELEKIGAAPENVFIAQVDSTGQLYLDFFDDAIQVPQPKSKDLLYSTLKKCQADCELFALGTRNQEAKQMYSSCSDIVDDIILELEPLLKR